MTSFSQEHHVSTDFSNIYLPVAVITQCKLHFQQVIVLLRCWRQKLHLMMIGKNIDKRTSEKPSIAIHFQVMRLKSAGYTHTNA